MKCSTFENLCYQISENGFNHINLTGGEPLIHPYIWDFIDMSREATSNGLVEVKTNGSLTDEALHLVELTLLGKVQGRLTISRFHDRSKVDKKVLRAFSTNSLIDDQRTALTAAVGRAKDFGYPYCPTDEFVIDQKGDVYNCGCLKDYLGNINDDSEIVSRGRKNCQHFLSIDDFRSLLLIELNRSLDAAGPNICQAQTLAIFEETKAKMRNFSLEKKS